MMNVRFVSFLRELAPYVVVVGSFARKDEHDSSDIDCFLRSRPVDEVDPEKSADYESYMPEVLALIQKYGFVSDSVIVGHIDVERQPGVPRMVEISTHYRIRHEEPVSVREIYGVPFLCAVDDKDAPPEECYDNADWSDVACDMVITHPAPAYEVLVRKAAGK